MQMCAPKLEALLTIVEVAQSLRISPRKLEGMIKAGCAPAFVRIGRLRRWEPKVVKSWLKANRVGCASPRVDQAWTEK